MDDDQKKRLAGECYRKGSEAMAKENWDFAVSMFSQCATFVPDNLMYRQVLRGSQRRKYNDNGSGAGKLARMGLVKLRTQLKKAHMAKETDWVEIAKIAEEGLKTNPWDAQFNFELGVACREQGQNEIAKMALEDAVKGEPDNKEYIRTLALLLEELGEYGPAVNLWEKIRKLDPMDGEARSKVTSVSAAEATDRGGYEKAENTRDVKHGSYDLDRPQQSKMPNAADEPGVSQEVDLQHAIRKDEANPDNYVKLASLYKGEKRFEEATGMLKKALEVSGGDQNIREMVEDAELDQMRQNVDLAKQAARKSEGDEAARKNASGLMKELWQREVEVLHSRTERYPKDSHLKFELSKRYMQAKQYPKAIPLLQQCTTDTRLESDVLTCLGECFINDGKEPLGRRQFEKVLSIVDRNERPDLYLKAHYILGRLCENAGKKKEAADHYEEVISVEYGYRDALARMEKTQSEEDEEDEDDAA